MSAAVDVSTARAAGVLAVAAQGSRVLDWLVAEALGWECRHETNARVWRRWRTTWSRGDVRRVPPRYTQSVDALLGELPALTPVRLVKGVAQGAPVSGWPATPAGACLAVLGEDEGEARAHGHTIELALAGALIRYRGAVVPDSAFAELGGRP